MSDPDAKGREGDEVVAAWDPRVLAALLRQADALERHEKRIATHTAIQTWVAILSVVTSTLTAVVLGFVTYQQLKTAAHQSDLDFARTSPQFRLEVKYARGWPAAANVVLDSGQANVFKIYARQYINSWDGKCSARVRNYFFFPPGARSSLTHPQVSQFISSQTPNSFAPAGKTVVYVVYADVFGERHVARLATEGEGVTEQEDLTRWWDPTAAMSDEAFLADQGSQHVLDISPSPSCDAYSRLPSDPAQRAALARQAEEERRRRKGEKGEH